MFASLAAVGSGLELAADSLKDGSHVRGAFALAALGGAVAFSLLCVMVVVWLAGVLGRMWWMAILALLCSFLGFFIASLGGAVVLGLGAIALAPILMVLAIRLD